MDEVNEGKKEISDGVHKNDAVKISGKQLTSKLRENPWILSTMVFAAIALVFVVTNFSGNLSGNVISSDTAVQNVLDILTASGANAQLIKVTETSGVYDVLVTIDGQQNDVFITKDGMLVGSLYPLEELKAFAALAAQNITLGNSTNSS